MVILVLAGAIGSAGVFIAQSHDLGPLSGFQIQRRLFHRIAWWNLTVPLIVVSVIGSGMAVVLAQLFTKLAPLGRVSSPFIGACLGAAVLTALTVGAGCGEIAVRTARTWRPSSE